MQKYFYNLTTKEFRVLYRDFHYDRNGRRVEKLDFWLYSGKASVYGNGQACLFSHHTIKSSFNRTLATEVKWTKELEKAGFVEIDQDFRLGVLPIQVARIKKIQTIWRNR